LTSKHVILYQIFGLKKYLNQRRYQAISEPCGYYGPQGSGPGKKAGFYGFRD